MSTFPWLIIILHALYISHVNCGIHKRDEDESYATGTPTPPAAETTASSTVACGIRPDMNHRIVGGNEARPHSWPWMANLLDSNKNHFCGGTLVRPNKIVTAAHCFRFMSANTKYYIRLGSHIRNELGDDEVELKVVNVDLHEKYNKSVSGSSHDVAVLTLEKSVTYTDEIKPMCLDTTLEVPSNITCYVTGWGDTEENGATSRTLQELEVPIISSEQCSKMLGEKFLGESQLCGGFVDGGKDSCQGDSGGPMSCQISEDEPWRLVGLVSWGKGCARSNNPGVYSRIGYFVDWINKHLDN